MYNTNQTTFSPQHVRVCRVQKSDCLYSTTHQNLVYNTNHTVCSLQHIRVCKEKTNQNICSLQHISVYNETQSRLFVNKKASETVMYNTNQNVSSLQRTRDCSVQHKTDRL